MDYEAVTRTANPIDKAEPQCGGDTRKLFAIISNGKRMSWTCPGCFDCRDEYGDLA